MYKYFLHIILVFTSLCSISGEKERELVHLLKGGNVEGAKRLLLEGADPSIAMIETEFLGPDFSDISYELMSKYGGNGQTAAKERQRTVTDLSDISDVITSAQLNFYRNKDNKDYFMIAPDLSKNPQPDQDHGYVTSFKNRPMHGKYLTWIQGANNREKWIEIADFARRGYGIIGLAQDLVSTDVHDVIAYHPNARKSADYLFDLIHPEPGTTRNHYQIGLLLSYWEPDVYAWCFGSAAAMKAYPMLEIDPFAQKQEGYDQREQEMFRNAGKRGLEAIPAEERQRVLHELDPQDDRFQK